MQIWTYKEALDKVVLDQDLAELFQADESFITKNEMIGYFNEGIIQAATDIQTANKDYFLTKYFIPLIEGQAVYALPDNIMANKIRGILYQNGSLTYTVDQFRRLDKFENIAMTNKYGASDYYGYFLKNDYPGQAQFELAPKSRESAVLPPAANPFVPMVMHYIRDCAKIPLIGEFCNPELILATSVNVGTDTIQTMSGDMDNIGIIAQGVAGCYPGSLAYSTGDAIKFKPTLGGTLPAPLVKGVTYYVIQTGAGVIKLATSKANAVLGSAIDLTTIGSVGFIITVVATEKIANATILDIPEFTMFLIQWAKCRCLEKERDPAYESALKILVQQKQQMIDTLTDAIQDDKSSEVEADYSAYRELS